MFGSEPFVERGDERWDQMWRRKLAPEDRTVTFSGSLEIVARPSAWSFAQHFDPLTPGPFAEAIGSANELADQCGVDRHGYFEVAGTSREALEFWACQEAVTTNAFSQLLFLCCAQIPNVHARAAFLPVIAGEHHYFRDNIAARSHPWLLRSLCESMGIDTASIKPASCTISFLDTLAETVRDPIAGLGALGVGNERMLVPEYMAVEHAFRRCAPDADFEDFLRSNIDEDIGHSEMLQRVAVALVNSKSDLERYYAGARAGVEARMRYYDELESMFRP